MGADWASGKNYTNRFGAHRVMLVAGTAMLWMNLVIVDVKPIVGMLLYLASISVALVGGLWTVALLGLRDMHMQNIEKLTYRERMQRMPWKLWAFDLSVLLFMAAVIFAI